MCVIKFDIKMFDRFFFCPLDLCCEVPGGVVVRERNTRDGALVDLLFPILNRKNIIRSYSEGGVQQARKVEYQMVRCC